MKDLRIKIMAMRLEVKEDLTKHSDWLCGQNKNNYPHNVLCR